VRKGLIDACPELKFIGRGGVGMDNIDVEYAREQGRTVANTPASSSQSVAELVMSHLFSLARGTYDSNRQMPGTGHDEFKKLKKKYAKGFELRGKTLGIIGFGRIGSYLAQYALGVGMKVICTDLFDVDTQVSFEVSGYGQVEVKVEKVEMEELIAQSDCISIHVPKQQDGSAVIGSAEIAKMKDGVVLVNAARGGVIDESALMSALDEGKVTAAALDVFENEPTPSKDILNNPKLALSPHIGAATSEAQDRIGVELADLIIGEFEVA
jgi:D-3-phosphoglycerate dehydrogenase